MKNWKLKSEKIFVFIAIFPILLSLLSFNIVSAESSSETNRGYFKIEIPQAFAAGATGSWGEPEKTTTPGGTDTIKRNEGGTDVARRPSQGVSIPNPLGVNTFAELIARINRWLLIIGGPIVTLMMFIGAFQIMTAGGNSEKVTTGRRTVTYAIVGYALLLLSTGITFIIKDVLGVK